MRCDGLTGLRELFQDHPRLLAPHLSKLMEGVLGRIIDSDASVRHALHTFLGFLFSSVSSHCIHTHFSSIVVHVSCGLTHISDRVQLDSLKIFGLLVNHYPTLLPPHAQHLLSLIVGLISRHSCAILSRKATTSKVQASLAHDPRSKLSKVSSRIEVFTLLSRFLETLFEYVGSTRKALSAHISDPESSPPIVDVQSQSVLVERDGEMLPACSKLCDFSTSVPHVMLLQQQGLPYQLGISPNVGDIASSTGSQSSLINASSESVFPDVSKFVGFSESLISLLLECWVECGPAQLSSSNSEVMNVPKNSLILMETIINLLCLVLKLAALVSTSDFDAQSTENGSIPSVVAVNVLSEKYAASFLKHFMMYFPLHCPVTSANFPQYMRMNLTLCQIMTLLSKSDHCSDQKALQSVCTFYSTLGQLVNPVLSSQSALEYSKIISETLPDLLASVDKHQMSDSDLQHVMNGLSAFYSWCHLQSSAKRSLIQCFRNLLDSFSTR